MYICFYDRGYRDQTALHFAIHDGYLEIVEFLIKNGVDVNTVDSYDDSESVNDFAPSKTPIHLAAMYDSTNQYGKTPLFRAVQHRNMAIANLLINAKAEVNIKSKSCEAHHCDGGEVLVHLVAENGDLEMVRLLFSKLYDKELCINARDKYGKAALYFVKH